MDTPHTPPALSALVDILAAADGAAHGDADMAPHAAALLPFVATSPHLGPVVVALAGGDRVAARTALDVLAAGEPRTVPDRRPVAVVGVAGTSLTPGDRLYLDICATALWASREHRFGREPIALWSAVNDIERAVRDAIVWSDEPPAEHLDARAEDYARDLASANADADPVELSQLIAAYRTAARLVRAVERGEQVDVLTAARMAVASSAQPVAAKVLA